MTNKFVLALDSTQLANYSACPTMWFLGDRRRLLRNDLAQIIPERKKDSALDKGTYIHKLFERYYKTYRFTYDQSNAIEYALAVDMDLIYCECGHPIEAHTDANMPTMCIHDDCDCAQFKPKPFALSQNGRSEVAQRFRESIYTWNRLGDFDIQSPEVVEVGFSELLYEDDEKIFILEGRMDIASASYKGTTVVVDHKLQDRRKDLYLKRIQFRNYAMISGQSQLVVNYVRMAKEASADTFARPMAAFNRAEQADWKRRLIGIYNDIADIMMWDEPFFKLQKMRQEWGNCETGNGYQACQFTPICEELYLGERLMEHRIDQLYQIKPEWKPW